MKCSICGQEYIDLGLGIGNICTLCKARRIPKKNPIQERLLKMSSDYRKAQKNYEDTKMNKWIVGCEELNSGYDFDIEITASDVGICGRSKIVVDFDIIINLNCVDIKSIRKVGV